MKIQYTNITHKDGVRNVELLITDNPDIDDAKEIIQIVVPVQLGEYPRIVEVELAALQRVQNIVAKEIKLRSDAAGRDY